MPRKKTDAPAAGSEAKKAGTAAKKGPAKKTAAGKTKAKTGAARRSATRKKPAAKKEVEKVNVVEAELVAENGNKKGGVGGNGNLIPLNQRSKEAQREIQEKGRQKNKENWEERKGLRKALQDFLNQQANPIIRGTMEKVGVPEEDQTNAMAMLAAAFSKAVTRGDINALRTVMEYAGQAPLQEMRENEAIAKMSQALQLAQQNGEDAAGDEEDVVFYIPDNGRTIILDEEPVNA